MLHLEAGDDGEQLTVINHIRSQSPDIAKGNEDESRTEAVGTDFGGAGDQGIMVGYATRETAEGMPNEWLLARNICAKLRDLRTAGWGFIAFGLLAPNLFATIGILVAHAFAWTTGTPPSTRRRAMRHACPAR